MASDKIGSEDIFKDDLFKKQKDSAQDFSSEISKLTTLLEGLTSVLSKNKQILEGSKTDSAKGIKQVNQALQESKIARQGVSAVQKQLNQLEDEAVKGKIRFNQANKRQRQELTDLIALERKEGENLNTLAAKNRQLRRERAEVNLKTVEGQKRIKEINIQLDKNNKLIRENSDALKKQRLNVGNYTSALGKVGNSLKNFAGAFGVTTGLVGLVSVFRNSIKIFRTFEKVQTDVASILQKSKDEIKDLTQQAKDLGATTFFTATEVSKLQVELAKLGFNQDQIKDSTEGVLNLAAAFSIDLAQAAKVVAGTLNGFNLNARESGRVADVLAKAFASSALDIEKFEVAISKVAPIAKGLNVDIETTTAVLGQLVNANFDASTAGTQFRNILLKLSNPASELANTLGFTVNSSDDLIESFRTLNKEQLSIAEAQGLIDVRSVALLKNISDNVDEVERLRKGLDEAGGTAEKIAKEQLKTLDGNLRLLSSAYEGFILSVEDGDGALGRLLKQIVQIITGVFNLLSGTDKAKQSFSELSLEVQSVSRSIVSFLNAATSVVKVVFDFRKIIILSIVAFKTYAIAVRFANKETLKYIKSTKLARIAAIAFSGGIKGVTKALGLFNKTILANPIGLLVSAISTAITAFILWNDTVDDSVDKQKDLNKELEKSKTLFDGLRPEEVAGAILTGDFGALAKASVEDLNAAVTEFKRQLDALVEEKVALPPILGETPEEFSIRRRKAFEAERAELIKLIGLTEKELKLRDDENSSLAEQTGLLNRKRNELKKERELRDEAETEEEIEERNKNIKALQKEIKRLEELGEIKKELSEIDKLRIKLNKSLIKSEQELQKAIADARKAIDKSFVIKSVQELEDATKNLDDFLQSIEDGEKLITTSGKGIFFKRREISKQAFDDLIADVENQSNEIIRITEEEFEARQRLLLNEKEEEERALKLRIQKREEAIQKDIDDIIRRKDAGEITSKEEFELFKNIVTRRANLEKQERAERDALQNKFLNQQKELNKEKNDAIIEQEEETSEKIKDLEFERIDLIRDRLLEEIDVYADYVNQIIALTEQKVQRQNELEEQAAQREVDLREGNATRQLELAKKGISAQYKFEEEKAAEARKSQLEIEERNRRQEQVIRLTSAYFKAFEARLSEAASNAALKEKGLPTVSGVTAGNAAAFALKDVFLAEAFSTAFGGNFATGVENFQGKGTETSDSNIIGFSHGESVVTAKGTRENSGLVTAMNNGTVDEYFKRVWLPKFDIDNSPKLFIDGKASGSYNDENLLSEIRSLKQVMSSRPVQRVDVDALGNIIETSYKNGVKTTVKHKRKTRI